MVEKQAPTPGKQIDAADVAALLKKARAPAVAAFGDLTRIVDLLAGIPGIIDDRRWLAERLKERSIYDRAQAAIDELRRVVPIIIKHEAGIGNFFDDEQYLNDAKSLERWFDTLPDFMARVSCPPFKEMYNDPQIYSPTKIWQGHAALLFLEYQAIVGKCGVSRDGPAVRFVKACFDFCGVHKATTLDGIEKAIRRAAAA
jgi:hypothetical protein